MKFRIGLIVVTALAAISSEAAETPGRKFTPASVQVLPDEVCKVYPTGTDPSAALTVVSDDDGYARFHAVRAQAGDPVQQLSLDCTDSAGQVSSYSVDLTSDNTFTPRPVNLSNERGKNRPALQGDPLSYSQSELIQAGYGLRPDPNKDPAAYSRWLAAASKSGRLLEAKRPDTHSHTVYSETAAPWTGSVLMGSPLYVSTNAQFNVPTAIPAGDGTTGTQISIWNGLGGFNTGSGLIQGGILLRTTSAVATYASWREYCCGDPNSNGYGGAFVPNPGDEIYSVEWYCDSAGNLNINGGYGCTFVQDLATGAILNCTLAGGSPCWSVPALPLCSVSPDTVSCMTLGKSAEFVIEDESPQLNPPTTAFTDFTPGVTISGSAYSSETGAYSQTISNDPSVYLLTDFTNATTHMNVSLGTTDQTYFDVSTYSFPLVTGLSPSSGPNTGGTQVTITGDRLSLGSSQPQITFGGTPATSVNCSSNVCTAINPGYIVSGGTAPQTVNVEVTLNGNSSPPTETSTFTYLPGPACTAALSCQGVSFGFPKLLVSCPTTANFYDGSLSQTPSSVNTTTFIGATDDVPGWLVAACTGQQPTLLGGYEGGSCSIYPASASPTYCGAPPPPPPNFCEECKATGGICSTDGDGRKICIHQ